MIVRTLAQQLHCPLAVYLQEQGVDSRRLKVAAYAGQLHDALKRFEQLLEENSTIEDSFPGLEQPYVLQRELPIEQWPEALRDAGIEGAILAMPVKADGMPRALLLFAMPEMKKEEERELLLQLVVVLLFNKFLLMMLLLPRPRPQIKLTSSQVGTQHPLMKMEQLLPFLLPTAIVTAILVIRTTTPNILS